MMNKSKSPGEDQRSNARWSNLSTQTIKKELEGLAALYGNQREWPYPKLEDKPIKMRQ